MAHYRTGTIALTNGSAAVIGSGTDFINGAAVGECVQAPDGKLYEIIKINCAQGTTVVNSVTLPSIELGQPYLGATASGQAYSIVPTQSYIRDLAKQAATLVNGYADVQTNALKLNSADKATIVDNDRLGGRDSVSGQAKLFSLSTIKTALLAAFKDTSGNLAGLTLFKLNLRNAANTFTSFLTNTATAARTWTMPDKDGTVAMTSDITAERTAAATLTNKTLTSPVINGGSVADLTSLTVDGNTTLGDASTDTVTISGNVGVGTTPSARVLSWAALKLGDLFSAIEAENRLYTAINLHNDGTNWKSQQVGYVGVNSFSYAGGVYSWSNGYSNVAGQTATLVERLVINSAGNVGIGTSTPADKLSVRNDTNGPLQISATNLNTSSNAFVGSVVASDSAAAVLFASSSTHIDMPRGGRSSTTGIYTGSMNTTGGLAFLARNSAGIITFHTGGDSERVRINNSGHVLTGTDNAQTLGTAAKRWSVVYAGTGAINTSDAREKTAVSALTPNEINAAKQLSKEIGTYKFLSSVQAKGDAARTHIGMTVQRAIEIMESHGLSPFDYGFICHDVWEDQFIEHPVIEAVEAVEAIEEVKDEDGNVITPAVAAVEAVEGKAAWTEQTQWAGDRYAFRYDQLNLFIAAGIEARLAALEAA